METILIVSSILLWLVVLFNLFLTFALIRRSNAAFQPPQRGGLKVGTEAPDFTAQTLSGESKTLADYLGRKVAFVFISSSCQPCRDLLSSLKQLAPKAQQAGIDIVLVSGDGREEAVALVDEMNIHLSLLLAPRASNSFFTDYNIVGTPSYCFINTRGKVHASGHPIVQFGEWKALTESWDTDEAYVPSERR